MVALCPQCPEESTSTTEKVIFMVEATTSKVSVIRDLILKVKALVAVLPAGAADRWVMICCLGRRLDCLGAVHECLV